MDSVAFNRIAGLRAALQRLGVEGFLVPRADEHLGEYVPESAERLAWLTGFTGSAGSAVVLQDRAAVFSDGRYTLQLAEQTDPAVWERHHSIEHPPQDWLAATAPQARIGYDPWLISEETLDRFRDKGLRMVALAENPVDAVWFDRPAPPSGPVRIQMLEHAGRTSAEKRAEIAGLLRAARQDAAVLTDPASICWLLNIRGADVPFTPFVLAFAVVDAAGGCTLFIDARRLAPELRAWLGTEVAVQPRAEMAAMLAGLAGKRVRVDAAGSPIWFADTLRQAGAEPVNAADPCLLPKACKNPAEQAGARNAHRRDAVAVIRFLHHIATQAPLGRLNELEAAATLLGLRRQVPLFRGESFPAISGAGEHGAVIHYRVTPETNRPIRPDEVYLIDSGGQYDDGTTDITRTLWTGPGPAPAALRENFTRVLQGHIALATLIFPKGVAGAHLDSFARRALWQVGLDYDHGTGHGVGSFLSVHEGPAGISRAARPVPLAAGMILSDEPGYYQTGGYGIRLENLLLVQPAELAQAAKPFLRFEPLTLAPFDRALIDAAMLTTAEADWLDGYHASVLAEIGPHLPPEVAGWLAVACAPIR